MLSIFEKKKSISESRILEGAADCHSHILPGVDDGIWDMEEALATLAFLEMQGLRTLWLTPHTMEDVPNTTTALTESFEGLKAAYSGPIELHLASEYMLDECFSRHLEERDFLCHGAGRVLVETSTWAAPFNMDRLLEELAAAGYTPILAHPERYTYLQDAAYARLREQGVLFQLNYPSLVGVYGDDARRKAEDLLAKGWYDMAGSDCHRLRKLEEHCGMKQLGDVTRERLHILMKKH